MIQSDQDNKILYTKYLSQTKEIASKISINETLALLKFILSSKEILKMSVNPLVTFDIMIKHIPRNI